MERSGHEIVWQVENEPYCRKVLAKHWPDVPCYEDIHDCGAHNLEEVSVICGGFPCQPVSVAGKQLAQDDERWLWPEFARVIRELRPRYALVENVPGLLVRGLGDVLGDLAELGYDAEWGCVSAASVGAPHLRKRIFIIAHTDSERGWTPEILWPQRGDTSEFGHDGEAGDVADTEGINGEGPERGRNRGGQSELPAGDSSSGRGEVAHPTGQFSDGSEDNRGRRFRPLPESGNGGEEARSLSSWWSVEPSVGRVAHGVPARVDRLRGLGNAIVPQVAEWIGRQLK